ncbi:hypothetical protein MKW98_024817 [Papaver atlanticum]|uniref:Uncharacterized protein n=1 Tax=Papaver atlanticum TaxID=357466 RepID=A0AAD4T4C0_9MAGN|nr:hypothetical protein MKW98_024817 [Papaver atlanticum]
MDLFTAAEDLKFFNPNQIIKEAVKIPAKSSPVKFFFITLTLILPLSLMQLLLETHSFILYYIFVDYFYGHEIDHSSPSYKQFIRTYSIQEFFYILSLFLFSIVSTSAIVFTVASLYASKSVYFIPTLFAIPPLFWGLSITFAIIYDLVHIYVTAQWHLASVISVLEANGYGLAAMKKSTQLLRGRTSIAFGLASLHLQATWTTVCLLLGLLCLFMLMAVNLTGLLVQSVFYYACKSHHNQVVDKKVLYDHLGSYDLGDKTVALNPSTGGVELQSLVKDQDSGLSACCVECNY